MMPNDEQMDMESRRDRDRSRRLQRLLVLAFSLAFSTVSVSAQPIDVEQWVEARTEDFVVRSDASAERAAEIARTLQVFRSTFAGLAPDFDLRSPVPTRILAFRDEESYSGFKRGQEGSSGRILGQFLTHPDGNFITLNADPTLLGGVGVVIHEYVHYLVSHNFPGIPRWFNEGLAEYYSTFALEGDFAVVGRPVGRHLAWLRRHGRIDIGEVLDVGAAGRRHSEVDAGHFYAVSWGLVHYLLSAQPPMASRLAIFLAESGDPAPSRRFEEIFNVRLADLEDALERYLLTTSPPAGSIPLESNTDAGAVRVMRALPADVLNDLGALHLRLGDDRSAGRSYDLALVYEPENGDAFAGLAHIRDLEQRFEDADYLFSRALETGPRDPTSYVALGRHLLARMDRARRSGDGGAAARHAQAAVQAFKGALDLYPGFAEASGLVGYTHLFGDLDPGEGIAHLEKAVEGLPDRVDLFFQLLQLEVRDGNIDRARALAAGTIRRLGGEEWGLKSDEEIDRVVLLRAADEALRDGRIEDGVELLSQAVAVTSDLDVRARLEENLARLETRLEAFAEGSR